MPYSPRALIPIMVKQHTPISKSKFSDSGHPNERMPGCATAIWRPYCGSDAAILRLRCACDAHAGLCMLKQQPE